MKKFLIIVLILLVFTNFVACNPERNESYSKEINKNDIIVEISPNTLTPSFIVRPQIDIDDLSIHIGFYDQNDYPVRAGTKRIGKVVAGNEYTVEFDYLTTKEILNMSKWKLINVEGKISIKQKFSVFCTQHHYDEGYINKKATCENLGEKIFTCKNCNYKKTESIERLEHDWVETKYSEMNYICTKCCIQCDYED